MSTTLLDRTNRQNAETGTIQRSPAKSVLSSFRFKRDANRRRARKRDVIEYIQRRVYLDLKANDIEPYMTQAELKWHTDIAYRRKDGVERGLLFNQARDCWEITRKGRKLIEMVIEDAKTRVFDVRKCSLWTKHLKRRLDPNYEPSEDDAQRKPKRGEPHHYTTLPDDLMD